MKKFITWMVAIVLLVGLSLIALIAPVDFTPLNQQPFYHKTLSNLDSVNPTIYNSKAILKSSWVAINITPKSRMPMAGYAPRDHFESVHDSVYVRILAIDNGSIRCFIISGDLLLFPPALKNKIISLVASKNQNQFLYFTATHAHSSLGAWNDTRIGNFILGKYDEKWLDSLATKISSSIQQLSEQLKPSSINYFETDASEFVENRLDPENGKVDGKIRGFKIQQEDGSKGLLISYSAHPTNINHLSLALSGDYPNALVQKAETSGYDFAMFASSTVGSHRVKTIHETQFQLCDTLASRLFKKIESAKSIKLKDSLQIATAIYPINYGPSQLHVLQNFKARDWVFRWLFTPLHGDITYLKMGNVMMLGMPCDFSGEIFTRDELGKIAETKNEKLLITSFNGDYVGYITSDDHYGHSEQEEVMAMNWVGPFYGEYFSQVVKKILSKEK